MDSDQCKKYIGQSRRSVEIRWYEHKNNVSRIARGLHPKSYIRKLYDAMHRHGSDKFTCKRLFTCQDQSLDTWEHIVIQHHNTIDDGYNTQTGGCGLKQHSDDTKKVISKQTSFNINDEKLDNFRKYAESKGLPKYVNYFRYKNCKGRNRNDRHGFNVYHSKLGKRKTITVPLGQSLDEIKVIALQYLEIFNKEYETIQNE